MLPSVWFASVGSSRHSCYGWSVSVNRETVSQCQQRDCQSVSTERLSVSQSVSVNRETVSQCQQRDCQSVSTERLSVSQSVSTERLSVSVNRETVSQCQQRLSVSVNRATVSQCQQRDCQSVSTERLSVSVNRETEGVGHGGSIERDGHMSSRCVGSVQREMDMGLAVMTGQYRGRWTWV